VRWIAVRGVASAVAGLVVLGVGGRLVMLGSRLIHLDARGRFTENGNRIGEFTIEGTIELLLFGGLLGGVVAGVVWALIGHWVPRHWAVVGAGAVGIGGFLLIEADNPDFFIVGNPAADIVLLLGLVFLFGAALQWLDPRLDARMPGPSSRVSIASYAILAGLGAPFLVPTFGQFLTEEFCFCESPPRWTGVFVVLAGVASLAWWALELRGRSEPPPWLVQTGRLAVLGAVVAGAVHLYGQVASIL
jgi:hypothetical protein